MKGSRLTITDPFADTTVEVKEPGVRPAPNSNDEVVVTLKGGAGFDAPWIVIHAADIPAAYEQFTGDHGALLADLMVKVKAAAQHFSGSGGGAAPAAQAAKQPPAGAPDCPPGWQFRSGVSKAGKPYKGFFPPRGDESKPIFFD
jgi:hypothetical protein